MSGPLAGDPCPSAHAVPQKCRNSVCRTGRLEVFSLFHALLLSGMGKKDDPKLMQEWFKLVQEKNALVRYESELMIFARELELEDRQSRLQQELRERMAIEDHLKTEAELADEKRILNEMLEVVEQRDSLVALLEEQRLREREEDKDLESVMLSKGFNLNWA
ncbi:protein-methionine sulfoxide oxidase mical3a isoform X2 [Tachysurus ichikawai]